MRKNVLATAETPKTATVIQLRNQARELGIKGFMRKKKAELIELISKALSGNSSEKNTPNVQIRKKSNQVNTKFKLGMSYATNREGYLKCKATLIAFEEIRSKRSKGKPAYFSKTALFETDCDDKNFRFIPGFVRTDSDSGCEWAFYNVYPPFQIYAHEIINNPLPKLSCIVPEYVFAVNESYSFSFKNEKYNITVTSRSDETLSFECEELYSKGVHDSRIITVPISVDNVSKSEFFCFPYGSCYAFDDTMQKKDDTRIPHDIDEEKASTQGIVQFSHGHSSDVRKFDDGVRYIQNFLRSGCFNYSPFYAEHETLKGMATQLGILRHRDDESLNDDFLRDSVIQNLNALYANLDDEREVKPKTLNNEYVLGKRENALQENLQLINSCRTRAELTLLLRTSEGSTLHRIFEAFHLIPYPYGGGALNDKMQIRDFVEFFFQKREGYDVRTLQPDLLIKALPAHTPSRIETIALDDLHAGIQKEQKRVLAFALALMNCGNSNDDYHGIIQMFNSVRYRDNTNDGFIDTFRMIFNAYDDSSDINPLVRLEDDENFRKIAREQIFFWGKQWAQQNRFSFSKTDRIKQNLQLARLDTWLDVIDDANYTDDSLDVIDAVIVDVPHHDEPLHQEQKAVTSDDWRKAASSVYHEIEEARRRINLTVAKKNQNQRVRSRNVSSALLPGQITIPFPKPYKKIH